MPNDTTVNIDGRWSLDDLATFSAKYNQCYSFIYSISPTVAEQEDILQIYKVYPWRGGYSTVHFFRQLYVRTPKDDRPEVRQIKYASPGFILLAQVASAAAVLAGIIITVAKSAERVSAAYTQIRKDMADRRLTQINLKKAEAEAVREEIETLREQMQFVEESLQWFSSELGIPEELLDVLNKRSGEEPLAQLKMLLSLYRRIEPLAKLQQNKKLDVTPLLETEPHGDDSAAA